MAHAAPPIPLTRRFPTADTLHLSADPRSTKYEDLLSWVRRDTLAANTAPDPLDDLKLHEEAVEEFPATSRHLVGHGVIDEKAGELTQHVACHAVGLTG